MTQEKTLQARELLIFSIYNKIDIEGYVTGMNDTLEPTKLVELYINPRQIDFSQPRIIQRIQTETFQRWVVQDWGPDLLTLRLTGQTGRLLPNTKTATTSYTRTTSTGKLGTNIYRETTKYSTYDILRNLLATNDPDILRLQQSFAHKKGLGRLLVKNQAKSPSEMMQLLSYSAVIGASEAFQKFQQLYFLYRDFDATNEVMQLVHGENVYRGYISEFNYVQASDKPWNWDYTLTFVVLADLNYPELSVQKGIELEINTQALKIPPRQP